LTFLPTLSSTISLIILISNLQDLTNANHSNNQNAKPIQHLPEKRGASGSAYMPSAPSNYQQQSFTVEQRDPDESTRQAMAPHYPMVRNVTDNTQQPISNPSSYQYGPSDNIDERDAEDPLCVTSYVEDMYHHFRSKETMTSVRPVFMETQPHINERMRSILVDWLVEVHLKFKLVPETLYLTVNLIDRYLERQEVSRPKLQLVGVTSLLIASKYEEIYPPELRDLVYICDRAYTRSEVCFHDRAFSAMNFRYFGLTPAFV
jgi:Cyclin, N-terminal domain